MRRGLVHQNLCQLDLFSRYIVSQQQLLVLAKLVGVLRNKVRVEMLKLTFSVSSLTCVLVPEFVADLVINGA